MHFLLTFNLLTSYKNQIHHNSNFVMKKEKTVELQYVKWYNGREYLCKWSSKMGMLVNRHRQLKLGNGFLDVLRGLLQNGKRFCIRNADAVVIAKSISWNKCHLRNPMLTSNIIYYFIPFKHHLLEERELHLVIY